jgi:hypothetical protein
MHQSWTQLLSGGKINCGDRDIICILIRDMTLEVKGQGHVTNVGQIIFFAQKFVSDHLEHTQNFALKFPKNLQNFQKKWNSPMTEPLWGSSRRNLMAPTPR